MPGLGTMVILLVANVIWLLLNLFASCVLKLSGEGANTIYWGRLFHALIARSRKECRYASVLALSVSKNDYDPMEYMLTGCLTSRFKIFIQPLAVVHRGSQHFNTFVIFAGGKFREK